ncbi:MAG: helix-turn-helix transcriptional regulator [Lachnospiraceae bacterium]|nr:helix-turn-helix transcriptional regulator [Lachnospiraceae bacterium]
MVRAYIEVDMKATGRRISELRMDRDITNQELAEMLGVTVQALGKWQTGKGLPRLTIALLLADVFGVHVEDLVAYRTRRE